MTRTGMMKTTSEIATALERYTNQVMAGLNEAVQLAKAGEPLTDVIDVLDTVEESLTKAIRNMKGSISNEA